MTIDLYSIPWFWLEREKRFHLLVEGDVQMVKRIVFAAFMVIVAVTTSRAAQRYDQYVDPKKRVVKTPEGFATNDDCWRTSWVYASLVVLHAKDVDLYQRLKADHGLDIVFVNEFLTYFRDNCLGEHGWKRPTTLSSDFSRDQLVPLLYLIACVKAYGPDDCQPVAKDILADLVRLVKKHGAVSDSSSGKIGGNLRYVIDVLSRKHGIDFVGGNQRAIYKTEFSVALKAHNLLAQINDTRDDFSVFNTLSLVTLQCVMWGKNDRDVKDWRANYRLHADRGWGPSFRIVSGRSQSNEEIDAYYTAHITRDQDNDIVLAQRPSKYISKKFAGPQLNQHGGAGEWLVLDYILLRGLQLAWQ